MRNSVKIFVADDFVYREEESNMILTYYKFDDISDGEICSESSSPTCVGIARIREKLIL